MSDRTALMSRLRNAVPLQDLFSGCSEGSGLQKEGGKQDECKKRIPSVAEQSSKVVEFHLR